ncbi:hypothetical protein P7C70_g8907, partial [Phenoliferia sp. Uapishka_3]
MSSTTSPPSETEDHLLQSPPGSPHGSPSYAAYQASPEPPQGYLETTHTPCKLSELDESIQDVLNDLRTSLFGRLQFPRKASRSTHVVTLLYITGLLSHPRWLVGEAHRFELGAHVRGLALDYARKVIAERSERDLPVCPFRASSPMTEAEALAVFNFYVDQLVWKKEVGLYFALKVSGETIQRPIADGTYHSRWYGMLRGDLYKFAQRYRLMEELAFSSNDVFVDEAFPDAWARRFKIKEERYFGFDRYGYEVGTTLWRMEHQLTGDVPVTNDESGEENESG